ncbi:MAG TPA: hypothetical protein DEA55_03550 [Rhodospirillaceae bacterium]|nr:hypothetical protein [Rhodospirillaceae bacterium]
MIGLIQLAIRILIDMGILGKIVDGGICLTGAFTSAAMGGISLYTGNASYELASAIVTGTYKYGFHAADIHNGLWLLALCSFLTTVSASMAVSSVELAHQSGNNFLKREPTEKENILSEKLLILSMLLATTAGGCITIFMGDSAISLASTEFTKYLKNGTESVDTGRLIKASIPGGGSILGAFGTFVAARITRKAYEEYKETVKEYNQNNPPLEL